MDILRVYSLASCGPYGGSNRRKHALGAKLPSGNEQQVFKTPGKLDARRVERCNNCCKYKVSKLESISISPNLGKSL